MNSEDATDLICKTVPLRIGLFMQENVEAAYMKMERAVDNFVAHADQFAEKYKCVAITARSEETLSQLKHYQALIAKTDDDMKHQQEQLDALNGRVQHQCADLQSIEEELTGLSSEQAVLNHLLPEGLVISF